MCRALYQLELVPRVHGDPRDVCVHGQWARLSGNSFLTSRPPPTVQSPACPLGSVSSASPSSTSLRLQGPHLAQLGSSRAWTAANSQLGFESYSLCDLGQLTCPLCASVPPGVL